LVMATARNQISRADRPALIVPKIEINWKMLTDPGEDLSPTGASSLSRNL
jgi:hypothetical protein